MVIGYNSFMEITARLAGRLELGQTCINGVVDAKQIGKKYDRVHGHIATYLDENLCTERTDEHTTGGLRQRFVRKQPPSEELCTDCVDSSSCPMFLLLLDPTNNRVFGIPGESVERYVTGNER